jgi:Tfp pilus assembly protein PilN
MSKINLLPPELKKEIEQAKLNSKIIKSTFRNLIFILIITATYAAAFAYFTTAANTSNAILAEKEKQVDRFGSLERDSKLISERLTLISNINKNTPVWSGVIEEIQNIMPSGVYLASVKMDEKAKSRNQISGYAITKREVAALRNLMEESKKFEYVDIESSTTVSNPRTNTEVESFSLTFSFEKGALK